MAEPRAKTEFFPTLDRTVDVFIEYVKGDPGSYRVGAIRGHDEPPFTEVIHGRAAAEKRAGELIILCNNSPGITCFTEDYELPDIAKNIPDTTQSSDQLKQN